MSYLMKYLLNGPWGWICKRLKYDLGNARQDAEWLKECPFKCKTAREWEGERKESEVAYSACSLILDKKMFFSPCQQKGFLIILLSSQLFFSYDCFWKRNKNLWEKDLTICLSRFLCWPCHHSTKHLQKQLLFLCKEWIPPTECLKILCRCCVQGAGNWNPPSNQRPGQGAATQLLHVSYLVVGTQELHNTELMAPLPACSHHDPSVLVCGVGTKTFCPVHRWTLTATLPAIFLSPMAIFFPSTSEVVQRDLALALCPTDEFQQTPLPKGCAIICESASVCRGLTFIPCLLSFQMVVGGLKCFTFPSDLTDKWLCEFSSFYS